MYFDVYKYRIGLFYVCKLPDLYMHNGRALSLYKQLSAKYVALCLTCARLGCYEHKYSVLFYITEVFGCVFVNRSAWLWFFCV